MATTDEIENTERAELETLRARVMALEAERAEEIARAYATVAAARSACTRPWCPAAAHVAARLFLRRVRGWVRSALR